MRPQGQVESDSGQGTLTTCSFIGFCRFSIGFDRFSIGLYRYFLGHGKRLTRWTLIERGSATTKGEVQGREWSRSLGILQVPGGPRNVKFYGFDFCENYLK